MWNTATNFRAWFCSWSFWQRGFDNKEHYRDVPKIREGPQQVAVVNWFIALVLITLLISIVYRSEAMVWFIVLTRVSPATIDAHMEAQLWCVGWSPHAELIMSASAAASSSSTASSTEAINYILLLWNGLNTTKENNKTRMRENKHASLETTLVQNFAKWVTHQPTDWPVQCRV